MIDKEIIPKQWEIKNLGDVLDNLESGKRPKGGVQGILVGIASIGAEHLDINGGFKFEKIKFVPPDFAKSMNKGKIEVNDIIVVKDGATTGKTSLIRQNFPYPLAVINEHVFICRVKKHISPEWIFYKLWSNEGKREILLDFRGAAQGGISSSFVKNVQIPIPQLSEQLQIVAKIEELFSELNNGKQQLETVRLQLKTYRQAVLKWAFEGRFTNKEFKMGHLPEGWRWVELDDICESKRKCSYGVLVPGDHEDDGIRLLRVGDINDTGQIDQINLKKISPSIANKYKRTFLEGGEVVISLVGAIGRTAVVPDSLKGANIARAVGVIPISKDISSKFVELMLRSPLKIKEHNEKSHEVARKTLNLEDVKNSKIPLPPRDVQEQIVQEIESRLSVCDKIEETIENCLQQSESLRQSILKQAFEGKLI